jgi:hypothetical protein
MATDTAHRQARQKATAARTPLELFDEDGVKHTFMASPFCEQDHAELDSFIQKTFLNNGLRMLEHVKPSERESLRRLLIREACSISAADVEGQRILMTLDGWVQILWQKIHRNHPEIRRDWLRTTLFAETTREGKANRKAATNLREVQNVFDLHEAGGSEAKKNPTP